MGVGPEKIVFAQTVKPVSHINVAKENNVRLMTFDNEEEMYKVKKNFPDAEWVERRLVKDDNRIFLDFN